MLNTRKEHTVPDFHIFSERYSACPGGAASAAHLRNILARMKLHFQCDGTSVTNAVTLLNSDFPAT